MRTQFAAFAEEHGVMVLSPLFVAGIGDPTDVHNYKLIEYRGIRFDEVLLAMVEQVAQIYRLAAERFLLFGFSGGGQFVHRFLYLHPRRLQAASIGAPGLVTLLDDQQPWWVGTGGLASTFGVEPDIAAMREVAVQMIVGADDTDTDILVEPESRLYMPAVNDAGATRIERLQALARSFRAAGVQVRFDLVSGAGHDTGEELVLDRVQEFFGTVLAGSRRAV
ncbi:hypothetical protein [Steroidobacter sp.]|uniref:hypothetical protein n=1 Tax=Steroidobacter sp. TaxID=1978227 RepID=UPI0025D3F905|nr:hypothetical protein [Steroidobacter sp.]